MAKKINLFKVVALLLILPLGQVYASGMQGGEVVGRHIFGLATDYQQMPLLVDERPLIYKESGPGHILAAGDERFMVNTFNGQVGSVYLSRLDPSTEKRVDTEALDLAAVGGLIFPAGGIKTAWNSVLFAEGGLVDAARPQGFVDRFKPYFKGKEALVNPYQYGWVAEVVVVDANGQAKIIKNYAMGRVFASTILAMPDGKTFYMLGGKEAGQLYLFLAEQPHSLSKGTLYVLADGGQGRLKPALLAKGSALKLKFKLKQASYKTIFSSAALKDGQCPAAYHLVRTVYGEECLKYKAKNKKYAGLFEPLRVMAMEGLRGTEDKYHDISFDSSLNRLVLRGKNNEEVRYSLGKDVSLNSEYIIKEPQ